MSCLTKNRMYLLKNLPIWYGPLHLPPYELTDNRIFWRDYLFWWSHNQNDSFMEHGYLIDDFKYLGDLMCDNNACKIQSFMEGIDQVQNRMTDNGNDYSTLSVKWIRLISKYYKVTFLWNLPWAVQLINPAKMSI